MIEKISLPSDKPNVHKKILCITLRTQKKRPSDYSGECPHCHKTCWQAESILDDAYGCMFKCPYCGTPMFLNPGEERGMRGYSRGVMYLDLLTKSEIKEYNLPDNTPHK